MGQTSVILFWFVFIWVQSLSLSMINIDDTNDWWEIEKTNEKLFAPFETSKIYLRFADLDDSKIHSCYEYRVINEFGVLTQSDYFCYPSIIITGVRKCSTSALYNLLIQYPNAKVSQMKENCPYIGDRSIIQYFNSLPRGVEANELIFDGCVDLKGNIKMRKILREPNAFYIVVVRDFSDWVWSAYNYWCQPKYDNECSVENYWVISEEHIRSPEIFHDIVMGSINGTSVPSPLLFDKPCDKGKDMFRSFIYTLWDQIAIENTLILSSEELDHNPEYVWYRLSQVIGLHRKHPKLKEFQGVRYNTQLNKGAEAKVSIDQYKPGLYAVSHYKPILESTRSVLDQCWHDDCVWSSVISGHHYPACMNSINLEDIQKLLFNDSHVHSYVHRLKLDREFLRLPYIKCATNFNNTLSYYHSIQQQLTHVNTQQQQQQEHQQRKDEVSHEDHKHDQHEHDDEHVLLISTSSDDLNYVTELLYHASGQQLVTDASVLMKDTTLTCKSNAISAVPKQLLPVQLTNSNNKNNNNQYKYGLKWNENEVKHIQHDVIFKKAIVILRDSLSSVWLSYQQSIGFPNGITNDALIHFNWSHWESSAIGLLSNRLSTNETIWTKEQSEMIDRMSDEQKIIIRIEDLLYKESKSKILFKLLKLIRPNIELRSTLKESDIVVVNNNGDSSDNDSKNRNSNSNNIVITSEESLRCANLLVNSKNNLTREGQQFTSRASIDMAYASEELLCKVIQVYGNSSLQLSSLNIPLNFSCDLPPGEKRDISRKCKLRYSRRGYIETVKRHPIALLAAPGVESVNVRLLIEHSTGIYTGAMETNRFLMELLHAEAYCGQRMSAIHASPHDVTIKNQRSGGGVISLTNAGKKKCMRGTIRGFPYGILLVRDPFAFVWKEYIRYKTALFEKQYEEKYGTNSANSNNDRSVTSNNNDSEIINKNKKNKKFKAQQLQNFTLETNEIKRILRNITNYYTKEHLQVTHAFDRLHDHNFESKNVLIVSYESLINPYYNNSFNNNKIKLSGYSILERMLDFAGFQNVYPERIECAFKFIEADNAIQQVNTMNQFYLSDKQLLCDMEKKFNSTIYSSNFPFIRLYNEIKCL